MNHYNLPVLFLTLLLTSQGNAQLVIDNSQTATALVQNVLLGGGVAVSNITFNGNSGNAVYEQLSAFNSANANVGINNGVFMASGGTQVAIGPNNFDNAEAPIAWSTTDPDLQSLANGEMINDAAVLEFDFIPSGSQISFNFVFASEEYLEFVDQFNDVFGFFLSGPGINGSFSNGAVNIALIPGTSTPVSINTLNNFDYPQYYVDNGDGFSFPFNSDDYYIQFDGLTTSIAATATVQCGQQYHIKLAVGDALDTYYDSGVFLQANAFSSPTMDVSVTPDLNLPCSGSVDISILNVTGGIPPYTYEWSFGGNAISTDQTITVGPGQNGTYTATVTDGCGGTMQEQVIVGAPVSPAIVLNLTPDLNLPCSGTVDIA
ncbi:MAG TPA: choice-of-anchor L domain-containing protein, partial [Flavobacteriales bacterium]|nr:choice-of-anchor L domain-containing protein [Flavobacteriales bacterium]